MATVPSRLLINGSTGKDVLLFQQGLNNRAKARSVHQIVADGVYGPATDDLYRTVGYALGLADSTLATKGATVGAQRIVRWPATRNPVQLARASARKKHNIGAPNPEITQFVVNQSSRNGTKPAIIVLHTTESHDEAGLADIQAIVSWFNNPKAAASSHVVNDAQGNDARLVPDENKAWTQAAYNSQALSIEQVGFAALTKAEWMKDRIKQLDNTALWVAYWSKKWDIPLVHSVTHGICQHSDLGVIGGGHHDCGPGYPFDYVLTKAKEFRGLL